MSISNGDFFLFYQRFLALVVAEGECDMHFAANYFCSDDEDDIWYEKAIAALTRLGISGLICCDEIEYDVRPFLKNLFLNRNDNTWIYRFFIPTKTAEKLAVRFLIYCDEENRPRILTVICEEFRKELGRIFDEHGVGFDVDLPYEKLLSLDSK